MEGLRPGNLDQLFLGKFGHGELCLAGCRQFGSQHHKLRLIESTLPFLNNDLGRVACLH